MRFKDGVIYDGIRPEMMVALGFLTAAYANFGKDLIVTSVKDGRHSTGSRHYSGYAVDVRIHHLIHEERAKLAAFCRAKLDPLGFDTVLEHDHLHCEWDPKSGERLWKREHEATQSSVTMEHFGES